MVRLNTIGSILVEVKYFNGELVYASIYGWKKFPDDNGNFPAYRQDNYLSSSIWWSENVETFDGQERKVFKRKEDSLVDYLEKIKKELSDFEIILREVD